MPLRILEQFAERIEVHQAQETLRMYQAFALVFGGKHETRRTLRSLERKAHGGIRAPRRTYKPEDEDARREAMAAFGGTIDDG